MSNDNGIENLPPPVLNLTQVESQTTNNDESVLFQSLKPSWCFGSKKDSEILNLCTNNTKKIFFSSSHIGVIYDFENNQQKLLQAHKNTIKCATISEDKRWLVTADEGSESTIVVWDTNTGMPVQTYFNYHDGGTISTAITSDSKYVATLGAKLPQILAIWEWTNDRDLPICSLNLDVTLGIQKRLCFNQENHFHLISNNENQVVFYEWQVSGIFLCFAPKLDECTFNKPIGKLTQSLFQIRNSRALTASNSGNLVVWDKMDTKDHICDKKPLKLFKVQEKGINVLTTMNDLIVIGDAEGQIKFIDQSLHLVMWYKHLFLGPISSISFKYTNKDMKININESVLETDATIQQKKFYCKDIIIGTTTAAIAEITNSCRTIKVICHGSESGIYALTCHPSLPRFCFGSSNGVLQLWDYKNYTRICSRSFDKYQEISCICYTDCGDLIAIGFKNGNLRIVDALVLNDILQAPLAYSQHAITHVAFSHDSSYLATAEADFTVSIYIKNINKENSELFIILGRYRSHYKPIVGLLFGVADDTNEIRLLSLGKDRNIVEYDLQKSKIDDIVLSSSKRIEQYATPLCMLWYPIVNKESFILTFNDQFKFKLYNATTKMCRKTLLGPSFGSLVKKMIAIPSIHSSRRDKYLAYISDEKIGLQKVPLSGNPFESVAAYAHPDGVFDLVASYDGEYLFTAGGDNCNVIMWKINPECLEAQASLGGSGLDPYYTLIPDGRDGLFFEEMKNLFYYSQLRHQGLKIDDERNIKETIPLSEIPFVMRGLGFFPTEEEIENIMNEVKFSRFAETGAFENSINLNELTKLYINHRPAFGFDCTEIFEAFDTLSSNKLSTIKFDDFVDQIQNKGEHMPRNELIECLLNLLPIDVDNTSTMNDYELQHLIPESINAEYFITNFMNIDKESYKQLLQNKQLRRNT